MIVPGPQHEPANLCRSISQCAVLGDVAGGMLTPLARALDATGSVFSRFSTPGRTRLLEQVESHGAAGPAAKAYTASAYRLDPFVEVGDFTAQRWFDTWFGPTGHSSDDAAVRDYRDRFIAPHAFGSLMRIQFAFDIGGVRTVAFMSFQRRQGNAAFDAGDAALLDSVGPVVRTTLRALLLEEQLGRLQAAVDALGGYFAREIRLHHRGHALSMTSSPMEHVAAETLTRGLRIKAPGSEDGRVQLVEPNASRWLGVNGWPALITPRELEVVLLARRGLSTLAMATELGVSTRTIENHLRAIYRKANVRGRSQLLARLLHEIEPPVDSLGDS
jgi:DNA-binding CsgD family transcriptional regulator